MSVTELEAERRKLDLPDQDDVNPNDPEPAVGQALAEREDEEPAQEELFVLEQGRRVTLSQMIGRGTTIEYRMTLNSKSFMGGTDMGLLPFANPDMLLVVPVKQGKVVIDPTYDEDGGVEKITMRVNFKPQTAHDAASVEGRALLGLEEA